MWYVLNSDGKIMARGVDNCAPDEDTITSLKKSGHKYKIGPDDKIAAEIKKKIEKSSTV